MSSAGDSVNYMTDTMRQESDLLTVAFSLKSNPGAYALLLGAGVSAPSGIPTAWGVLEDLVTRSAELAGAQPTDPVAWYQKQFGEEPTYEGVLEHIAPTQIERQRLLRGYFEQSPADRDAGRKMATPAHHAIAQLVQSGAVKVIVTLNFDHLIEQALRERGIEPTVIASPADIDGMAPLHTLECCVVHLHGDYLNPTTMLNTVAELKAYHPRTAMLLRRILEDYGLIIAGWSARYDPALRDAIATHYPARFTLTWFEPAESSEEARNLRTLKKGIHVAQNADIGFGRLADGVAALTARQSRHPLTIPVAVETAKRELAGHTVAIGLHDRLQHEFDTLHRLPEFHLSDYNNGADYEPMITRVEEAARLPAALLATLAFWGNDRTDAWWSDEIPRFATPVDGSGLTALLSLRVIAGSFLFYAAGIAAVAGQRYDLLGRLFSLRRPNRYNGQFETIASALDAEAGYSDNSSKHTRLYEIVNPLLRDTLSLGAELLEDAWQMFEVLRLAWVASQSPGFAALRDDYLTKDAAFQAADTAFEEARRTGTDLQSFQASRSRTWEDCDRTLGNLSRLVILGRPHVLTVDDRLNGKQRSVTATRLLHDFSAEGTSHPLIASGLFADVASASVALAAVGSGLGAVGHGLSWERVRGSAGSIPMQMWLDSGLTPAERARNSPLTTE